MSDFINGFALGIGLKKRAFESEARYIRRVVKKLNDKYFFSGYIL